jgi:nitroreductase
MKLKKACMDQDQIEECYALFIFCAMENVEDRINQFVELTGKTKSKKYMLDWINNKVPSKLEWVKRQAYIALGFAMAAAAEKKIAGCPMEGFVPEDVAKILNLDSNLKPCVLFAVGRHNPNYKLEKRFRFSDIINDVKL